MGRRETLSDVGFGVAVACTVVLTAVFVWRTLSFGQQPSDNLAAPIPLDEPSISAATSAGHVLGDRSAPVAVVVFSDFECAACRAFALGVFPRIDSLHPGRVKVLFRHWPLGNHAMAYSAARAAECAAEQGRFKPMHDVLFRQQRALGIIPLSTMAQSAGVPDSTVFDSCMSRTEPVDAVERDMLLAEQLGAKGTPAVVVGGVLFRAGIDWQVLDSIVKASY